MTDIVEELKRPGRDPREQFETFSFSEEVNRIGDLKPGMKLPGIVTNVTNFGAFVDVGVHQDGLVHISRLADKFVKDPNDVVKVQQKVSVTVMEVDLPRNRISLSMKANPGEAAPRSPGQERKPTERKPKQGRPGSQQRTEPPEAESALADALRRAGVN